MRYDIRVIRAAAAVDREDLAAFRVQGHTTGSDQAAHGPLNERARGNIAVVVDVPHAYEAGPCASRGGFSRFLEFLLRPRSVEAIRFEQLFAHALLREEIRPVPGSTAT